MSITFQKHFGSKTDVSFSQHNFNNVHGFHVQLRLRSNVVGVGDEGRSSLTMLLVVWRLVREDAALSFFWYDDVALCFLWREDAALCFLSG